MLAATEAKAFELGAGFAAVEEGDDRMRPGAAVHLGIDPLYASRLYYYGREFGPVKEETTLISVSRRWGLFKSNQLSASAGLAIMNERITLNYDQEDDAAFNESEDNYNGGLAVGIAWSLPKSASPLFLQVAWDSHIFPAGLGVIALSTGRKQTISFTLGVTF